MFYLGLPRRDRVNTRPCPSMDMSACDLCKSSHNKRKHSLYQLPGIPDQVSVVCLPGASLFFEVAPFFAESV